MLDQIMLLGNRFVVVGDFNVPGDVAGQLDPRAVDVLTQYGLRQHVTGPTHISGNTLNLILSRDEQISEQLVSMVTVQSVTVSVLLGSPSADLLSWSTAAAASHVDIQLPVAAQDRHGSLQCRHSAVQAV